MQNMTGKQIVSDLMKKQGVANCDMATAIGVTQATLWERLNPKKSDNMTIKTLQEMAGVLGYEVVVVKKGTLVDDAYYIGDSYIAAKNAKE